jgi:hypothetical protein
MKKERREKKWERGWVIKPQARQPNPKRREKKKNGKDGG